jgi:Ni/Fe-hydrogenase subunit HybB-like protein
MAVALAAAVHVFINGLVVTNLTDLVPWGLWIGIDLSAIALSAGAFSLSAAVYLLGWKQLQPVARTAVFIGFLGYSMAMLCLLMDIGRPDRFWHAVAFWNIHSPLWEVTMCVMLYFTVLMLEVAPIFGADLWQARRPAHLVPAVADGYLLLPLGHRRRHGSGDVHLPRCRQPLATGTH